MLRVSEQYFLSSVTFYLILTNLHSHELNSDAMECYNIEPGQRSVLTT